MTMNDSTFGMSIALSWQLVMAVPHIEHSVAYKYSLFYILLPFYTNCLILL